MQLEKASLVRWNILLIMSGVLYSKTSFYQETTEPAFCLALQNFTSALWSLGLYFLPIAFSSRMSLLLKMRLQQHHHLFLRPTYGRTANTASAQSLWYACSTKHMSTLVVRNLSCCTFSGLHICMVMRQHYSGNNHAIQVNIDQPSRHFSH